MQEAQQDYTHHNLGRSGRAANNAQERDFNPPLNFAQPLPTALLSADAFNAVLNRAPGRVDGDFFAGSAAHQSFSDGRNRGYFAG